MSSLSHGRLLEELLRVHDALEGDESDLLVARSALMWLCVAQKRLRAHELWIALQVEESKDVEHVERLVTQREYVDERRAADSLTRILKRVITVEEGSGNDNTLFVRFRDPEMRTFLMHPTGDLPSVFVFSTEQAHILAASVCMITCSTTGMHLAHVHDRSTASSLVLYAWTFWPTHFRLSGFTLGNANAATLFDAMACRVAVDALVFIMMLKNFITGPISFSARNYARLPAIAALRRAQQSLERPMALLSGLMRHRGYAAVLQQARQAVEESSYDGELPMASPSGGWGFGSLDLDGNNSVASAGRLGAEGEEAITTTTTTTATTRRPRIVRTGGSAAEDPKHISHASSITSQIEILQIDRALRKTTPLFADDERRIVLSFAELARSLRLVSVSFVRQPIRDELQDDFAGPWSPMDVLYHLANWCEAVACYPYWDQIPDDWTRTSYQIRDMDDYNRQPALEVLEQVRATGEGEPFRQRGCVRRHNAWQRPPDISMPRWYAALAVETLRDYFAYSRPGMIVVNPVRLLSARETSFANLRPEAHNSTMQFRQLRHVDPLIPKPVRDFYRRHVKPLQQRLLGSAFFKSLDDYSSTAFTAGMTQRWPSAKASILRSGYRRAFAYFIIAVLTHHIRRTLVPWLGLYMYYTPLNDIKMALSSPEVFLDESLSRRWRYILFMTLQKWAADLFGTVMVGLLSLDVEQHERQHSPSRAFSIERRPNVPAITMRASVSVPSPVMDAARVGYLVWTLANVEYIFARSVNTVAFLAAYFELVFLGGDREHIALGRVLQRRWTKVPVHLWQLAFYMTNGLWPIISGAVVSALAGQAALLVVVLGAAGAVALVTMYSNKLYILLELGGLVLAVGLCVMVTAILAWEFVGDPLGLGETTRAVRRLGNAAWRSLPPGGAARLGILRGRTVVPIVLPDQRVEASGARMRGAARSRSQGGGRELDWDR